LGKISYPTKSPAISIMQFEILVINYSSFILLLLDINRK
jgi:hypothetical protein